MRYTIRSCGMAETTVMVEGGANGVLGCEEEKICVEKVRQDGRALIEAR